METELWNTGTYDRLPAVDESEPFGREPSGVHREVSRALKNLAKELKIPIIALSQLSRAVDARPDHKPVLSDLRESGSIEQDADVVMFIYRDEYYNPETTEKPQTAEIIIAKQRSGETGSVDLRWIGKYTKFADPEKHYKG